MAISIIAALAPNGAIGKDNKLIWNIPEDLQNFKKLTSGNVIVMGRKTYESIGKPLPNRVNIVVSGSMAAVPGLIVCKDVDEAIVEAKKHNKEIFIIGGANVFAQSINVADKMYLSYVKKEYEGDVFFPKIDINDWKVVEQNDFSDFKFMVYERKR